ncbi:OLC1v1000340C1 [Oldenlandia corymbosa var. corymbosa]|uniref:OLC1v1000340C1 n=1 Tax=Oldenlandia corymbosa var. corymbosa TaxID=529605 RepID=A0AAV1D3J6_OLDCO|nr:OLC1v1000340C1 [Oldenlandia corymbosa var. corymbosa]
MATTPGLLTDWPWTPLGSFKYVVLAPWVVHSIYSFVAKDESQRDLGNLLVFPVLLWRALHNQIWISISRHRTANGKNRIVDKPIEFDQVDRESNWDDQIILNGVLFYIFTTTVSQASRLPWWRTDGVIITALLHAGPVEFLYYWLHRALHHHFLYSRYHSHHHSSIVTEPISSVIHPFAEHISYFLLFAIPTLTTVLNGTASLVSIVGYITFVDLMNNMGHCNFELIPNQLFSIFPLLKYLMYTPTYHSLHHTQFRTNYALFMPMYDYIYGTMDKSTDSLYESSLKRQEDAADVVHLTHLTTPESIYHLRLGFAHVASKPQLEDDSSPWYFWFMRPVTFLSMIINYVYGNTFILERNAFDKLKLQIWAIPRYNLQYLVKWQSEAINGLIEKAILDADEKGTKVLSLGLLNQGDRNKNGELFVQKYPKLKVRVVDGSSLAVAIVLNSIPKGTTGVLLRGNLNKVAHSIVFALCQKGVQVTIPSEYKYEKLKLMAGPESNNNLVYSKSIAHKIWLVGDGSTEEDQLNAPKGTIFIPFGQFPPKKLRNDCLYHNTPAMLAPFSLQNLDSCENWLPRRALSAARVAGVLHGIEGWNVNECGEEMFDVDKVWEASLKHGFRPLDPSSILY